MEHVTSVSNCYRLVFQMFFLFYFVRKQHCAISLGIFCMQHNWLLRCWAIFQLLAEDAVFANRFNRNLVPTARIGIVLFVCLRLFHLRLLVVDAVISPQHAESVSSISFNAVDVPSFLSHQLPWHSVVLLTLAMAELIRSPSTARSARVWFSVWPRLCVILVRCDSGPFPSCTVHNSEVGYSKEIWPAI